MSKGPLLAGSWAEGLGELGRSGFKVKSQKGRIRFITKFINEGSRKPVSFH